MTTRKPQLKNAKLFALPLDTITDKGLVDLRKIKPRAMVLGYDTENGKEVINKVKKFEKIKKTGDFYAINGELLLFQDQSIYANGKVTHAKLLKKGDELIGLQGTKIILESLEKLTGDHYFYRFEIDGDHTYFINGYLVHNASRFWVLGTGNWDASTTTNWAASSGGAGGNSVPTSSDDVTFDLHSNEPTDAAYTFTITATATCNNLDISFTGTTKVTWAGSSALQITGNLNLSGGTAQITRSFTGTILFNSTASGKTITLNSVLMNNDTTFNGVAGAWTFQDTYDNNQSDFILTNGTLDTNGKAVTVGTFNISGSAARTLTLGASSITADTWTATTVTNLTFNANTSTINWRNASTTFAGGGLTYNNVAATWSVSQNKSLTGANTFANFTITGGSSASMTLSANQIITTLFTINGISAASRPLIKSSATGTARTITSASNTISNADFQDITGAGAGSWNLSANTTGDCGGNSGITFTTPATQHWISASGGNWNDATKWTSRVPLPQDDVVMDSAFSASQTVVANVSRLGKSIDWTGATGTPAWTTSTATSIFGSLTLISGMTISASTQVYTFEGRSTYTITNATKVWAKQFSFDAFGGSYTFLDDYETTSTGQFVVNSGTLTANGNVKAGSFAFVGGSAMTINMGSGTWEMFATNQFSVTSASTFNAGTSTLKFTDTSTSNITFTGAGKTFYKVWFDRGGSTGNLTISGSNTFNELKDTGTTAHNLLITAGTNQTITNWSVSGNSGQLIVLNSTSTSTYTLTKAGGGVASADYLDIQHCLAKPGNWYAGLNSVNHQGDATAGSGWIFDIPPIPAKINQAPARQAVNRAGTY